MALACNSVTEGLCNLLSAKALYYTANGIYAIFRYYGTFFEIKRARPDGLLAGLFLMGAAVLI